MCYGTPYDRKIIWQKNQCEWRQTFNRYSLPSMWWQHFPLISLFSLFIILLTSLIFHRRPTSFLMLVFLTFSCKDWTYRDLQKGYVQVSTQERKKIVKIPSGATLLILSCDPSWATFSFLTLRYWTHYFMQVALLHACMFIERWPCSRGNPKDVL